MQEFDDIYDKKIAKRYDKYELQRLSSKRKTLLEKEKPELEDLSS
jgi:DNA-directed RNA polymerase subunit K/omega